MTRIASPNAQRHTGINATVVGLIPAAGQARRLAPLPCSKELYPLGFKIDKEGQPQGPKVVCQHVLEKMRLAGITNIYIILRAGKFDLPAYLGDGRTLGLHLAYLMMGLPFGVPFTLDQAYPFVRDSVVALGFPDILFEPDDAFVKTLDRLSQGSYDVVVGVFPADRPEKVDMVELSDGFDIQRIIIKPPRTHLRLTWGLAVWKPAFTHFMHEWLKSTLRARAVDVEIFIGEAIQAAIDDGLRVGAVQVSSKPFLDVGTPEDLVTALKHFLDEA